MRTIEAAKDDAGVLRRWPPKEDVFLHIRMVGGDIGNRRVTKKGEKLVVKRTSQEGTSRSFHIKHHWLNHHLSLPDFRCRTGGMMV